jgi:hypothetical protein
MPGTEALLHAPRVIVKCGTHFIRKFKRIALQNGIKFHEFNFSGNELCLLGLQPLSSK